jgi:hypothetical protein
MPLTPYLKDSGLDQEGTRVAKLAFEIARLGIGAPDRDSLIIAALAKRTVELAKAGERNPDLLCEQVLADVRTQHPEDRRKSSLGEMIARWFKPKEAGGA